ncbi:MAG: hypothetical protein L3J71_07270 [Victivallaceae bacterium]|nr:hypothetical protein [Victivallaceae bacterium]
MKTEEQLKLELAEARNEVRDLENRFANLSHSLKGSVAGIQAALHNAIKYASFVERAQRQKQINIIASGDCIEIKITNSFLPRTREKVLVWDRLL